MVGSLEEGTRERVVTLSIYCFRFVGNHNILLDSVNKSRMDNQEGWIPSKYRIRLIKLLSRKTIVVSL